MKTKLIIIAMLFIVPSIVNAGWYNNSWKYRRCILVTSTPTVTNAQIFVSKETADIDNLVSELKMNSDLSDVRFTANDGTTLISHWKAEDSSGIYVKVPTINSGRNSIYMYYGNASAVNTGAFSDTMGVQPANDIVGLYRLNEATGTVLIDQSSLGNTATAYADVAWNIPDCPRWGDDTLVVSTGSSLYFSGGSNGHAQIGMHSGLNTSKDMTVALWYKPSTLDTSIFQHIIERKDNNSDWLGWWLVFPTDEGSNNRISFEVNNRSIKCYADNLLAVGKWVHIAVTYDSAKKEIVLYVDGKRQSATSGVATVNADVNAIIQLSASVTLRGNLDEIVLSKKAMSESEIAALYKRHTYIQASASYEAPSEVSSFTPSTQVLRPGTATTFTYVFKERMNTAVLPSIYVWLPDNTKIAFQGAWSDEYTYTASYTIPAGVKEGFADIAIADALTAAGMSVGDYRSKMALAPESLIPEGKKEFWPNPFSPNGDGFADKTTLFLRLDASSDVKVTIYDLQGTVIRYLYKGTANGQINIEWDGKDNAGEMAPIGLYIYQIENGSAVTSGSIALTK